VDCIPRSMNVILQRVELTDEIQYFKLHLNLQKLQKRRNRRNQRSLLKLRIRSYLKFIKMDSTQSTMNMSGNGYIYLVTDGTSDISED